MTDFKDEVIARVIEKAKGGKNQDPVAKSARAGKVAEGTPLRELDGEWVAGNTVDAAAAFIVSAFNAMGGTTQHDLNFAVVSARVEKVGAKARLWLRCAVEMPADIAAKLKKGKDAPAPAPAPAGSAAAAASHGQTPGT